jgi:hypothetical protein
VKREMTLNDTKPGDLLRIKWGDDWYELGMIVERKEEKAKHIVNRGGYVTTIKVLLSDGRCESFPVIPMWENKFEVIND